MERTVIFIRIIWDLNCKDELVERCGLVDAGTGCVGAGNTSGVQFVFD
jgi:hypothetical protein